MKTLAALAAHLLRPRRRRRCRPTAEIPNVTCDANHPVLLLLRDLPTGSILFAGEVTDPSQH